MNERQFFLVKVIQKIAVFEGFELTDIQRLLRICKMRELKAGEQVYTKGEESNDMLVLLRGKLSVTGDSGEELAEVRPGNPTGEMGVFTRQPRSANIVASERSTAIVLGRQELGVLLGANEGMHVKVLQNLVAILSQRIEQANELTESQARMIRDLHKRDGEFDDDDDDDEYEDEYEDEDEDEDDEDEKDDEVEAVEVE